MLIKFHVGLEVAHVYYSVSIASPVDYLELKSTQKVACFKLVHSDPSLKRARPLPLSAWQ